jgi:hypothetical protein
MELQSHSHQYQAKTLTLLLIESILLTLTNISDDNIYVWGRSKVFHYGVVFCCMIKGGYPVVPITLSKLFQGLAKPM